MVAWYVWSKLKLQLITSECYQSVADCFLLVNAPIVLCGGHSCSGFLRCIDCQDYRYSSSCIISVSGRLLILYSNSKWKLEHISIFQDATTARPRKDSNQALTGYYYCWSLVLTATAIQLLNTKSEFVNKYVDYGRRRRQSAKSFNSHKKCCPIILHRRLQRSCFNIILISFLITFQVNPQTHSRLMKIFDTFLESNAKDPIAA